MNTFTKKMIDVELVQDEIQICIEFENKAIEEENWLDAMYYLGWKHALQTSIGQ